MPPGRLMQVSRWQGTFSAKSQRPWVGLKWVPVAHSCGNSRPFTQSTQAVHEFGTPTCLAHWKMKWKIFANFDPNNPNKPREFRRPGKFDRGPSPVSHKCCEWSQNASFQDIYAQMACTRHTKSIYRSRSCHSQGLLQSFGLFRALLNEMDSDAHLYPREVRCKGSLDFESDRRRLPLSKRESQPPWPTLKLIASSHYPQLQAGRLTFSHFNFIIFCLVGVEGFVLNSVPRWISTVDWAGEKHKINIYRPRRCQQFDVKQDMIALWFVRYHSQR